MARVGARVLPGVCVVPSRHDVRGHPVSCAVAMANLDGIFQAAMGWTNERYGMQFDEYPEGEIDEKQVTVMRAIGEHSSFSYEYDFGDSWEHEIVIEEFARPPLGMKHAVCLDGQNACPPEDCGGTGGYAELLQALADPEHDEHDHLLAWVGGPFDPTLFDLVMVNVVLVLPPRAGARRRAGAVGLGRASPPPGPTTPSSGSPRPDPEA